ncbi:MAG: hypothetical protein HYT12_00815 [Candidatus Liptonbacteria bacterium]|nr:hypothetical protein [Candidatus Liptonbacteria bacterium]
MARRFRWIAPPSRPSIHDIANYHSALRETSPLKKILILGATPELRIIAGNFSNNVTVADFSLGMFKAVSHFVPYDIQSKEEKIIINWLKLPSQLPNYSYDAVLGDLVIRQLPMNLMEEFLKAVYLMLRPGGVFITRTNILNILWKNKNPQKIILDGAEDYYTKQISSAASTALFRLYDHCTDPETRALNVDLVNEAFKQAIKEAPTASIKEGVNLLWKDIGKPRASWTQADKYTLESIAKKYFDIKAKYFAGDYPDSQFIPMYAFCVRGRI